MCAPIHRPRRGLAVLSTLAALGCTPAATSGDPDAGAGTDAPRSDAGASSATIGPTDRPARLVFPAAHDGTTELPLIVLLHGYGASATLQDGFLHVSRAARTRGAYVLLPDGTMDSGGSRFWNATDACCNFDGSTVDDVAYLDGLLDDAIAAVPIDESRIYFMGHSNGGFMSYRMAREHAERIAAIAPLAGVDYLDETVCVPTMPVSVLQWHGTLDDTVEYAGVAGRQPGAEESARRWAVRAGCDPTGVMEAPFDASNGVPGDETIVTHWTAGCPTGVDVLLWRMEGEDHIPELADGTIPAVLDWLLTHRR